MTTPTLDLDLPELADTASEAEMLAAANARLYALKQVRVDMESGRAELAATIELMTERHREREAALLATAEYLEGFLERVLEAYPPTGKAKSRKLLAGTIGTRHKGGRYEIASGSELLEWAIEHDPGLIEAKVTQRVRADVLKEYIAAGGERPPGVEYVEPTDTFYASCA